MKPIAQIVAKDDGTFDIAAVPMDPRALVNILLSLAAAVVNRMSMEPTRPESPLTVTRGEVPYGCVAVEKHNDLRATTDEATTRECGCPV